jgi:hypothetical protein
MCQYSENRKFTDKEIGQKYRNKKISTGTRPGLLLHQTSNIKHQTSNINPVQEKSHFVSNTPAQTSILFKRILILSLIRTSKPTSVPISLPESHIQHTQSELELESMNLQAEHKDVQMYARLLFGMHDQMRRRVSASGKVDVHPLSRKSFDGIIKTKLANIRDLEHKEVSARVRTDNLGWITSYNEHIAEKDETCSNHSLYNIIGSTEEVDDTEDDFIFNMEL